MIDREPFMQSRCLGRPLFIDFTVGQNFLIFPRQLGISRPDWFAEDCLVSQAYPQNLTNCGLCTKPRVFRGLGGGRARERPRHDQSRRLRPAFPAVVSGRCFQMSEISSPLQRRPVRFPNETRFVYIRSFALRVLAPANGSNCGSFHFAIAPNLRARDAVAKSRPSRRRPPKWRARDRRYRHKPLKNRVVYEDAELARKRGPI